MNSNPLYSKKNNCKSCYKCIRSCPTKSLTFYDGQAHIIQDECIYCGTCYYTCPQNCKIIRDDTQEIKNLLAKGNCYASIAPSFLASYPGSSFVKIREALLKIGFADAEETAVGATIVKKAYDDLVYSHTQDIIISTCCHSVNLLVQKHFPDLVQYLAPVLSPMQAHAMDLKKRHPGCTVIFFGPCISKKDEVSLSSKYNDLSATYIELDALLKEKQIQVELDSNPVEEVKTKARLFPIEGGVLQTMEKGDPEYQYLAISGIQTIIGALEDIRSGGIHKVFIEMSACEGSCINGPVLRRQNALKSYLEIVHSAGKEDFSVETYSYTNLSKEMPGVFKEKKKHTPEEIQAVLREIGKTKPEHELNCGSCGYSTCREKAQAVLDGKASVSMCLPFLMEKATSVSNDVINNSPNAIIVTDEQLNITLTNKVAARIFKTSLMEMLGKSLADFIDVSLFLDALEGHPTITKRIYWEEYKTYVEATITYNEEFHIISGTFRDRTQHELERQQKEEATKQTAEITQKVIERNMRAVQEIAQLLGESAADTKIALTNLQKVITKDNDDK